MNRVGTYEEQIGEISKSLSGGPSNALTNGRSAFHQVLICPEFAQNGKPPQNTPYVNL